MWWLQCDSNGSVQDGELTYNHTNEMRRIRGERAVSFTQTEYKKSVTRANGKR